MEKPNLTYIQQLSGGDQSFEKSLINIIKEEFPIEKKSYLKNIKANNFKLTAGNVHKIKHKISIFGLEKDYELAVKFENQLLNDNKSNQKKFDAILNKITIFLNQL